MRLRFLFILIVPITAFIVVYFVASSKFPPASQAQFTNDPIADYPHRIDLGEHEIGDRAVAHFTISNHGKAELVIDKVHSNCSCTGMEGENEGRYYLIEELHVKPGEAADLVMRVSVRGVPVGAEMINVVEFRTNDPLRPDGRIEAVVRRVTGGISTHPRAIVFGSVRVGADVRQIVDIRDSALTPRRVESIASTNPERVRVRLLPQAPDQVEENRHRDGKLIARAEVIVDTQIAAGIDAELLIQLSGDIRSPDPLPVTGKIVAPIELSPANLTLPRSSTSGPLYNAECICRSTNGLPLSLSLQDVATGLTVEVLDRKGDSPVRIVRVSCDPKLVQTSHGEPRIIKLRATSGSDEAVLELTVLLQP